MGSEQIDSHAENRYFVAMIRVCEIIVFCLALLSAGCNETETSEPIWEQVKIGDLASPDSGKEPGGKLLKATNFDVSIFEMPAQNVSMLEDVWPMLYMMPLRFHDFEAFRANSFSVGFGQMGVWEKIDALLRGAEARKLKTISLLLPEGQANDVAVARLEGEQAIFYVSADDSMEGVSVGPGQLSLRIKAEQIPGYRGVCRMRAVPVFSLPARGPIARPEGYTGSDEFIFGSAGFESRMSPGSFVLLGPEKYIANQMTLGGLFFNRPGRPPVVRVYLIVCSRIAY